MAHAVAPRLTKVPEIRAGDTVVVLAGKDAGKRGEVKRVERPALVGQPYRVVVEGLNLAKRHTKPRPKMNQNDRTPQMQQGGIIEKPMGVPIGRVMLVCPRCDHPTRIRHLQLETGARVRACGHCGQAVEVKGA
ncbi:MAG: 50S ribosomal protein L24 [Chloroflexi bacterium]|nr:50S ribosomal protein L24 [Chloroflexota bacterium]